LEKHGTYTFTVLVDSYSVSIANIKKKMSLYLANMISNCISFDQLGTQMSSQLSITPKEFWFTFTSDLTFLNKYLNPSGVLYELYMDKSCPHYREPWARNTREVYYQKKFKEFSYIRPFWEPYSSHRSSYIYHNTVLRSDKTKTMSDFCFDCAQILLKEKTITNKRTLVVRLGNKLFLPYL
jgi:hypothetical protein